MKDGWSEALTEVGELWRHKARQRGLLPPWLGWPPTPSACRCPHPRVEGTEGKGGAHKSGNGCQSSRGGQATLAENQSVP